MTPHTFPFCSLVFVTFHFLKFVKVDDEVQLVELLHWIALEWPQPYHNMCIYSVKLKTKTYMNHNVDGFD